MEDEVKIAIHSDVQDNDANVESNTFSRMIARRASSLCCIGFTVFVAFIILLPVLLARLLSFIISAPIGIFCYYYRTHKYAEWLREWKSTLDTEDIEMITDYLNGPISLSTFDAITYKIRPHFYIEITQTITNHEQERLKYKYVPKYLLQNRFWPCNTMVSKSDFIDGMIFMQNILIAENGKIDTVPVSRKLLINLVIDIQQQCSICMQDYIREEIDELHITKCTHLYHKKCINMWKQRNPVCPICRSNIA